MLTLAQKRRIVIALCPGVTQESAKDAATGMTFYRVTNFGSPFMDGVQRQYASIEAAWDFAYRWCELAHTQRVFTYIQNVRAAEMEELYLALGKFEMDDLEAA